MIPSTALLTVLVAVTSYHSGSSQQQYIIKYTNLSNLISCWKEGAQLPCQDVVQVLKEAQIQSNISSAPVTPTGDSGANDMECPTWMYYSNETNSCLCGAEYHGVVKCNATLKETYLLGCYQMTFDDKFQRVIVGLSFYGCTNQASVYSNYHRVPANRSQINEVMCSQFYRGGRLCGACRDGYSPLVYSYQVYCKQCSDTESKYNWAIFAAVTFIPLTFFYIFVILFKFNANSPQLNAFAFLAQSVSNPANIRGILSSSTTYGPFAIFLLKLLATLYGIWNLDYFRMLYPDICLRLTTLQALSLDYITAFYPLVLIMFTYFAIKLYSRECRVVMWMWRPIKACLLKVKKTDDIKTSLIDVFATFLILSYQKLLSVNFDLLAFTSPIDSSGKSVGKFLYYDANYEYFGPHHLPYGILAIFSFTIFNFLPFILLLFYPMRWFQKCLNSFKLSHLALHTFVDSFAGCYKDGTESGTRDCRYFAALFLLLRIVPYIIYQVTLDVSFYGWNGILFSLFAILYAIVQPYKSKYKEYNAVTVIMIVALVMIIVGIIIVSIALIEVHQTVKFSAAVAGILIALPQLYPVAIGVKWMYGYKHVIFERILLKIRPSMNRSSSESSLLIESDCRTRSYSCKQVA